jgi:glycosyltransferase involved in cell wall biosynthesis
MQPARSSLRPDHATARKICIVTPDVIGPLKNGGIGTHCYHLAVVLAKAGHDVTIVFTGPIEHENNAHWQDYFRTLGISFHNINEMVDGSIVAHSDWFVKRSFLIFNFLKARQFDLIHFQEWQANGLHTIMAKRSTEFFQDTTISVTMHSSTEWINEGMLKWVDWAVPDAKLSWCERYCCQYADVLFAPSEHMFQYALERKWLLAENRHIHPYCFEEVEQSAPYDPAPGVLAFFGRLETRKGLEIFLGALGRLPEEARSRIRKVLFLGKNGHLSGAGTDGYAEINRVCRELGIPYEVDTTLSAFDAVEKIRAERAIAVVPSLLDNYPFTILECLMSGIPTIAAGTGGIPEMLDESCLFKANEKDIAAKLTSILKGEMPRFLGKYDPVVAKNRWLALHDNSAIRGKHADAVTAVATNKPLVSVCIPFYNYGMYLEATIKSLQASTYENFECIIVNDGSTDPFSAEKFSEIAQTLTDKRFRLLSKENGGVGAARNHAANQAKGEFLLFCDADNCSEPTMIQEFLVAIHMTGGDVVSSNFKAFAQDVDWPDEKTKIEYLYLPVGPAIEIGMIDNVFGDANSLFRRAAFEAVGGFQEERHTSWEDWDLHARCCLAGFQLDVCPKQLFWYRHTDAGFSRNTSTYQNQLRVLKAYSDYGPAYIRPLLKNLVLPYHFGFVRVHNQLIEADAENNRNRAAGHLHPLTFRSWLAAGLRLLKGG